MTKIKGERERKNQTLFCNQNKIVIHHHKQIGYDLQPEQNKKLREREKINFRLIVKKRERKIFIQRIFLIKVTVQILYCVTHCQT